MQHTDVAIIGGGLAGGIAAFHLARSGARVTLFERTEGPHDKVCGEFLSGEALAELRLAGLDPVSLGAVSLNRVRIAARRAPSSSPLPFEAFSLTRRVLDEALLDTAGRAGAVIRRGAFVRSLSFVDGTPLIALRSGEQISADAVVLSTGKHDLSGNRRPPARHDGMVGIKTYVDLSREAAADLQGAVDVVFFPGGYCGFQAVEDGRVNACLAVEQHVLEACGGDPGAVFGEVARRSSHARSLLEGAEFLLDRPLAVGRVPYGMVRERTDGPYFVGDQAAVIPSFCGEGMGLALRSGRLAAEAILRGEAATIYQRQFAQLSGVRVALAARASRTLARPRPQSVAAGLARLAPSLVGVLASATRTPGSPGMGKAV